jgi:uncharacterized protein YjbI with pentapeptide repeats
MTIPFRNLGHFLVGFKGCSRQPPAPEMMVVVRATYTIGRDGSLTLRASDDITPAHVEQAREANERAGLIAEKARMRLGQGTLLPETYRDDDEERVGELVYPGDFADFKLNAEVVARGSCHADKDATESMVELSVGDWSKTLQVVGTRVRTDDIAGGHATKPQAIGVMALDYAHAYGGPEFEGNRVGKGYVAPPKNEEAKAAPESDDEEPIYQPPRSQRSQVMPSQQLPNVLYPDGAEVKNGLPAGFGPLSTTHPHRAQYVGKKYGAEWLQKRAPFPAADFDFRHEHAAPPDQQLAGYLRGDESVSFKNFHPHRQRLTVTLPGLRVRVFVIDDRDEVREAPMSLDTLYADLDDDALYLTWRGHTPVREEDLTDIRYGFCAVEPLGDKPLASAHYEELLRAFAADPNDMENAFPAGFDELAECLERIESASDDDLERMADRCMETSDPGGPVAAAMRMLFGSTLDELPADALPSVGKLHAKLSDEEMREKVLETLQSTSPPAGAGIDLDKGELRFPVGRLAKELEAGLAKAEEAPLGKKQKAKIEAARERLAAVDIAAIDPAYGVEGSDDEPGPGANLAGRDLSNLDLRRVDLTGADLRSAVLSRTNLEGAKLIDAHLGGAQLFRTNLEGADLTGADLTTASFRRVRAKAASFVRARLDMTRFDQSDLENASFSEATGRMPMFSKTRLSGARASGLSLEKALFDECLLVGTDLSHAQLLSCTFKDCKAVKLNLDSANLPNTAFHMCRAQGLQARGATGELSVWMRTELEGADFGMASLPAAHFMLVLAPDVSFLSANLPQARFDRAVLKRGCFDGAKLSHANLRHAVLSKATFVKASLYDAKLMQSHGVDVDFGGANLEHANFHRSRITRR